MGQLRNVAPSAIIVVGVLALAGCSNSDSTTASTTTPATTAAVVAPPEAPTTSATDDSGPKALVTGTLLEPGEYVTTDFEPTVLYHMERRHLLRAFQNERITGLENRPNDVIYDDPGAAYRSVSIQNFWHGLTPEEVLEKLEETGQIGFGQMTETEIGGFPGSRIEANVTQRAGLWNTLARGDQGRAWFVQPGPLVVIILETPAGTLLITIQSPAEEWDEFLPIAEEILAGVSFPDLEGA